MTATSVGLVSLRQLQLAIESAKYTQEVATHVWLGPVTINAQDRIVIPHYAKGIPGAHVVEDAYIMGAGTQFNFQDKDISVEELAYFFQSIKKAATSAGTTPFLLDNFAFPVTNALNDFNTLSFEFSLGGMQEYECNGGVFTEINLHGDGDTDGGALKCNATAIARKRAADSLTASLTSIPLITPLSIRAGTVKFDALGTAAGTAAASSNHLLAFECKIVPGLEPDYSVSGRADMDYAGIFYNGMHIVTGKITVYADAATVTRIAAARTPTGKVMQIAIPGAGTRSLKMNLPLSWTKDVDAWDKDRRGFEIVEFEFEAGYSKTSTAQGISFPLNLSASTTLT